MNREVVVAGVGLLPWRSRHADKTYAELAVDAARAAFEDARLPREEVDFIVYGLADVMVPVLRQACAGTVIQDYLGLPGKASTTVTAGACTGAMAVRAGCAEIAAGLADVVLVVGTAKALDLYDPLTGKNSAGFLRAITLDLDTVWETPVEPLAAANFAFCVQGHIDRYGGPSESQMARVSVKNHRNALLNPLAQSGIELTVEDVLRSRRLAGPIKFYDCCLYSEGAAAVILMSADKARGLPGKAIHVTGMGASNLRSYMPGPVQGRLFCQQISSQTAYKMAGIRNPLEDLDLIELHDLLSGVEIMSYGELGLCEIGKGGSLIDDGIVARDGLLPVNPSGGMMGCGHAAGPSGISRVGEVVLQLRGEAGRRQVSIKKGRGVVSCIGGPGISQSATLVLEVPDARRTI